MRVDQRFVRVCTACRTADHAARTEPVFGAGLDPGDVAVEHVEGALTPVHGGSRGPVRRTHRTRPARHPHSQRDVHAQAVVVTPTDSTGRAYHVLRHSHRSCSDAASGSDGIGTSGESRGHPLKSGAAATRSGESRRHHVRLRTAFGAVAVAAALDDHRCRVRRLGTRC